MRKLLSSIRRFLSELRRRNVYQVAVTYAIVGFFVIEGADLVLTRLGLPPWTVTFVIVLVGLGFPIALVLAWALEMTPEGVRVEETAAEEIEGSEDVSAPPSTPRGLWVGASVLVLVVLGVWWVSADGMFGGQSGRQAAMPTGMSLDSTRVVVFPFTVGGGDDIAYLGEGMVELMGRSLDGAGPLTAVDPKAVLAHVDAEAASGLSPDSARRIAARLGAGRYVLGSVLELGETLQISATWYSHRGTEIGATQVEGQGEGDVQHMVDALARSAIADLTEGGLERRRQLAAQTTSSAEALKSYLEGQEAFRALNFRRASKAFSDAVQTDSSFALAHYRLSLALGWTGRDTRRAHKHAQRAVALSDALPRRDRRLLRAHMAYGDGKPVVAERLYRTLLQNHPNDVEAQYQLGEVLFHFNGVRGQPIAESRRYFRRAMEIDSTFRVALAHRVHLALLERNWTRLDSLTRGIDLARYEVTRAYVLSQGPSAALTERLGKNPAWMWITAWALPLGGKMEAALELLAPLTAPDRTDQMRAAALVPQSSVLAAQGRLHAAREKIEQTAPLDSAAYWMARSRLANLPFRPDPPKRAAQRQIVRRGLEAWDADAAPERLLPTLFLAPRRLYPLGQRYRLGLLHAMTGDPDEALTVADQLASMDPTPFAASAPADFARSIRAEVARHRGNPDRALAELRRRENRAAPLHILLDPLSGARERFLRAELLARQGHLEDALRWYRTLNGISRGELPYLAPAHLGRARVLEQLGRPEAAAAAYRRALALWEDPDPSFQPRVEAARQQLADLGVDTTTVSVLGPQTPQ